MGVQFSRKKPYVTLERPLHANITIKKVLKYTSHHHLIFKLANHEAGQIMEYSNRNRCVSCEHAKMFQTCDSVNIQTMKHPLTCCLMNRKATPYIAVAHVQCCPERCDVIVVIIYTKILLMSVCRCSQTAGHNSCSIVSGDVSNCSYRLTIHLVRSSHLSSAYQFVYTSKTPKTSEKPDRPCQLFD